MPITSPVERISGPRMVSTPGNFWNGNTDSLTATCMGQGPVEHLELVQRAARP